MQYIEKYSSAFWGTSFVRELSRVDPAKAIVDAGISRRRQSHSGSRTPLRGGLSMMSGSGITQIDIDREGLTYTIDTLRELHADRPGVELFFITGADALAQIFEWHASSELFELAHFVGVTRPGYTLEMDDRFPPGAVSLVEVPALTISSSDCRDRVRRGAPIWYLVPDTVVRYVDKRRLYRDDAPAPGPSTPDEADPQVTEA